MAVKNDSQLTDYYDKLKNDGYDANANLPAKDNKPTTPGQNYYNSQGFPVSYAGANGNVRNSEPAITSGGFSPVLSEWVSKAAQGVQDAVAAANKALENYNPDGGGNGGGAKEKAPSYDTTVPTVFGDTTDPELKKQYEQAMATLEGMKGKAPVYGSQYDAQIQDLYQQIIGRDKFKYDSKTDPLYQQYVQDAVTQGKMAMRDTMGQAAALTGGYGSSYAQAVGQQQYDQYLQRLADVLPQTYGMALDAWKAEGDQLNEKLATTTSLEQSDYNRYLDALNQHNIDLNRAQSDADTWYGRMTDAEKQAYSRQLDKFDMQGDYYNRLATLMSVGYKPTKEEYNAAGLSEAQGEALRAAYTKPTGGGGYRIKDETPATDTEGGVDLYAFLATLLAPEEEQKPQTNKTGNGGR